MKTISLTKSGLIYLFTSIILLFIGVIRGEIFITICSISLFIYILTVFFLLLFTVCFWKDVKLSININDNNVIEVFPIEKKSLPLLLPCFIPCYIFNFFTEIENKKSKNIIINIKLNKIKTIFSVNNKTERGVFFNVKEYLELKDIAGFVSAKFFSEKKSIHELSFIPSYIIEDKIKLPDFFVDYADSFLNFTRNDELYDMRQYVAGDDTRKINWKVYAHINQLAIMQGDFAPPPNDFLTIIFQTPIVYKITEFSRIAFEKFVESTVSILINLYLLNKSFKIILFDQNKQHFKIQTFFCDDKNCIEKIKSFFSIPQLYIDLNKRNPQKKIQILYNDLDDNESNVLYFIMPILFSAFDVSEIINEFKYDNTSVYVYDYESIIKSLKKNPDIQILSNKTNNRVKKLIHKFLFIKRSEVKHFKYAISLNKKANILKSEIQKRGIYVCTI